ncbi:MAG: FHA domain-containing protein [Gammaproteobacteria bacterium]|nr:FHA domain-containing protein [Gammaproteobacteria bacterium]
MKKIIVNRENFKIDEIELDQGTLSIGRSKERDLTIDDRTVSNHHANIVTIFGSTYIEDQGSTNGTFVNGKQTNTHTLHHGDVVTIGHYQLLFHGDTPDNPLLPTNATQVLDQGQVANLLELANQRNKGKDQKAKPRTAPRPVARANRKPPEKSKQPPVQKKPPESNESNKGDEGSKSNELPDVGTPDRLQDEPLAQPRGERRRRRSDTSPVASLKTIMLAILAAGVIFGLLFAYYIQ